MHDAQELRGILHATCGLLQPMCAMCMRYVICYNLYAWCKGDMWAIASYVCAVTCAMWAVAASMCDMQVPCELLHLLCRLHRQCVGCYILYVDCCRIRVGSYVLYEWLAGVMWAVASSMWAVASSMSEVTVYVHDVQVPPCSARDPSRIIFF